MAKQRYKIIYLGGPLHNKIETVAVLQRTIIAVKLATNKDSAAGTARYKLIDPIKLSSSQEIVLYRYRYVAGKKK